ncbi:MAG: HAMP domain-containing protein [Deltaproteobacteria bacterium]|nr:HAMP domain-containing protein [Deltaproteobacteria bacterium]RLB67547.1 MAG: histidine kinase [Deltaproteobacteria bacterium]
MFFKSLIGRIIILSFLLFIVAIGSVTLFHIHREHAHITTNSLRTADLMMSVIERSITSSMRSGNTRDVQAILEMVGSDPRLAGVRIFHPDGRVLKSSEPHEIGRRVDPHSLAIFLNGQQHDIFRGPTGDEVMGVVKPIYSEQNCVPCHGAGHRVIGILNLDLSLAEMEAQLLASSQLFGLTMLIIVLLLTGGISLIFHRFVRQPLKNISIKMAQVENGDLTVKLEPQSEDEVSSLMTSFNSMVDRLRQANDELQECHYQQMERVDRLASVGEMSAGIAHEIKNPLAAISGAITVLSDDFAEDDPRREVISKVLEQIARLDKAATDLLFFGRPGKPSFDFVDTNDLLNKTMFFVSQHPEAKNVHQSKEFTRHLPPVWVDEKQLQQVFFNIIINAIQAMKDGGTLLLQTDLVEDQDRKIVRVLIGDSGPGIKAEDLESVFTPFFTTKTQGTGLGLAICRQLMEQQGGDITVSSRLGEGTRVVINLPVSEDVPDMNEEKRA